ncbi:hypothetical protein AYO40_02465 [Planctomycetaceae bacterium SCGC AG-212-D15]|nr:hypothetical protein AYO40_02465 [Planctomycetaceae bacterium SCGC AG-212-D15]
MDGFMSRKLSRWWNTFLPGGCLVLSTAAGCTHHEQDLVRGPDGDLVAVERAEPESKRPPKPESLVALANFRAKSANEPNRTPAIQEALRDEARLAYQKAIELDPKCLVAYIGLASLYQDMSEYDRASAAFDKATKLAPKNAEVWFRYGMCQARHKDWEKAVDSLRTANQIDPENKRYLNSLGFSLARSGRFDESYSCFAKEMGEGKAHYNVARMLHHVQRDTECKRHLELALKVSPDLEDARKLLAEVENGTNKDVVPAGGTVSR